MNHQGATTTNTYLVYRKAGIKHVPGRQLDESFSDEAFLANSVL
jgi:hypothetical protein